MGEGTDGADGAPEEEAPPKRTGGSRLGSIEDEAELAEARLRQLEHSSGQLRESVDALAEATVELRRQSAQMREAALRVAEAAALARKKRTRDRPDGQAADRPPRTK